MRKATVRFTAYLILTGALPVLLLYPSLVYLDLSGMGGYDGFASTAMMERHGMWSATNGHTAFYFVVNGIFLLWCLSCVNLPIALIVIGRRIQRTSHKRRNLDRRDTVGDHDRY